MRNIEADGFLDRPNIYKNMPNMNTLTGLYYSCWDKDIDRAEPLARRREYTDENIKKIIDTSAEELEKRYEDITQTGIREMHTGKENADPLTTYIAGLSWLAKRDMLSTREATSFLEEQIFHLTNLQKDNPLHTELIEKAYRMIGNSYKQSRKDKSDIRYIVMYKKAEEKAEHNIKN